MRLDCSQDLRGGMLHWSHCQGLPASSTIRREERDSTETSRLISLSGTQSDLLTNTQHGRLQSHEQVVGDVKVLQLCQRLDQLGVQADQIVGGEVDMFEVWVVMEDVSIEGDDVHASQR